MTQTRAVRHVCASPESLFRALTDAEAVAAWRVPEGMSAVVHEFDAHVGGRFRISLTYKSPGGQGKTTTDTDTYHGRFIELVPNERVVEEFEFETSDPALRGVMRMTTTLAGTDGGTDVVMVHEGLPPAVSAEDNEMGTRMALDNLAALVGAASSSSERRVMADNETFQQAAERIYHGWDEALSNDDVEALLALYAPDAVLESPAVPLTMGTETGVCRGHDELRPLLERVAARKPPLRTYYRTGYLTDGSRTMIFEYPRDTPDGEQMDFVEVMEIADGLIQRHCVYWGWRGVKVIQDDAYHK